MAMVSAAIRQWKAKVRKQEVKREAALMAALKFFFGFYFCLLRFDF
jgi:hypothetical protein